MERNLKLVTLCLAGLFASSLTATSEAEVEMKDETVMLPSADKVHLFLLIGQSNMAGRGRIEEIDRIEDPRILSYNKAGQWQVARDPLHWDKPAVVGVGPGMSFARELAKDLPSGSVIGLIPAAWGGTSIDWWSRDYEGPRKFYGEQSLYWHAVERARAASRDGTLRGILWSQGATDAEATKQDDGKSYKEQLYTLIANLRADLGQPDLPFIACTLGPWKEYDQPVNRIYLQLPKDVPNTAVVNTLDPAVAPLLVNDPNDAPHYLTPAYRVFGKLFADAFRPWWPPANE